MAPGTKRIAIGGLALALVAWSAIWAYLPDPRPPEPAPRNGEGMRPIPEVVSPHAKGMVAKDCGASVPSAAPASTAPIIVQDAATSAAAPATRPADTKPCS